MNNDYVALLLLKFGGYLSGELMVIVFLPVSNL